MRLTTDNKFKKLIVIGDRVLIRLTKPSERTERLRHTRAGG